MDPCLVLAHLPSMPPLYQNVTYCNPGEDMPDHPKPIRKPSHSSLYLNTSFGMLLWDVGLSSSLSSVD